MTTYAAPRDDTNPAGTCANCGDEIIRNYDGLGTGWSHIYPEGHPLWLRSGTKECSPLAGHPAGPCDDPDCEVPPVRFDCTPSTGC